MRYGPFAIPRMVFTSDRLTVPASFHSTTNCFPLSSIFFLFFLLSIVCWNGPSLTGHNIQKVMPVRQSICPAHSHVSKQRNHRRRRHVPASLSVCSAIKSSRRYVFVVCGKANKKKPPYPVTTPPMMTRRWKGIAGERWKQQSIDMAAFGAIYTVARGKPGPKVRAEATWKSGNFRKKITVIVNIICREDDKFSYSNFWWNFNEKRYNHRRLCWFYSKIHRKLE